MSVTAGPANSPTASGCRHGTAVTDTLFCFPDLPCSDVVCNHRSLVIHKSISVANGSLAPLNSPEESQP